MQKKEDTIRKRIAYSNIDVVFISRKCNDYLCRSASSVGQAGHVGHLETTCNIVSN